MKLKKIASLALAGIMAVSMLAGCKYGEGSSSSSEGTVVTPVDNSLAAYLNDEMKDKEKALITFSSDADVQAALEKVAAGMDETTLKTANTWVAGTNNAVVIFNEMVDGDNAALSDLAHLNATKDLTVAKLFVVPGNYTEEAMKESFKAALVDEYVNSTDMPVYGKANNVGYDYTYAGKVAVTKVTSLTGDYSAYVIGVVIDKTVTERA